MAVPDRRHRWWEWLTALSMAIPAVLVRGGDRPGFLTGLGEQLVATALIVRLRTRPVIGFGAILRNWRRGCCRESADSFVPEPRTRTLEES